MRNLRPDIGRPAHPPETAIGRQKPPKPRYPVRAQWLSPQSDRISIDGVNTMQKKPPSTAVRLLMCCASFGAWCAFELTNGSSWQFVVGATVIWTLVMCLVIVARLCKRKTA
jgi:hypothetical protein